MSSLVRRYYEAPVVALFDAAARLMVHTSDVWRLAALYLFGGVYFDVEVRPRPLREVIRFPQGVEQHRRRHHDQQRFFATPPGNPLAQLLERAAEQGYEPVAREYIHYCREIYHVASARSAGSVQATTRCSPACIRRGLSTSSLSESVPHGGQGVPADEARAVLLGVIRTARSP